MVNTLRSGWITRGPKTALFEAECAAYLGVPSSLALNSCTAGLHVALVALGVAQGDEVITTPNTFVSTANVIEHVGARPILVDIDPITMNLDVQRVERAISKRTRVILPVHFAGHPVELDSLSEICKRYDLKILEDAAHAFGASYRGVPIGATGNPTAFSFYATKNLTTGEGGLLTGPAECLDLARSLSLHGMSRDAWRRYEKSGSWFYEVRHAGFKCNMTDIQAALGRVQLKKFPQFQKRRTEIAQRYLLGLKDCELTLPVSLEHVDSAWHLFVIRLNPKALTITRDQFIEELTQRNVGTSVHFIPLHNHAYYREKYKYAPSDFSVAQTSFENSLSLPLNLCMSNSDVDYVIEAVRDTLVAFQR